MRAALLLAAALAAPAAAQTGAGRPGALDYAREQGITARLNYDQRDAMAGHRYGYEPRDVDRRFYADRSDRRGWSDRRDEGPYLSRDADDDGYWQDGDRDRGLLRDRLRRDARARHGYRHDVCYGARC